MSKKNKYYHVGEKGFFPAWVSKLLFTLISVKFWGLVSSIAISTHLLMIQKIEAQQWVVFNTTIWGLIFGMKEVFRISQDKNQAEQELQNQQGQHKLQEIKMKTDNVQPTTTQVDTNGKEIVGAEPS